MPTVLRIGAYRFFFYSNEGGEPAHIHIEAGMKTAKYWLGEIELAHSNGFRAHELTEIRSLVAKHRNMFVEAWHAHFDDTP